MQKSLHQAWLQSLKVYAHKRVLTLFLFGFSAGLPLLLIFSTFSFWLRKAGIERSTIGFLSWITLIYGFKWVWAPLVDRLRLPYLTAQLGRRRAWLLLAQILLIGATLGMAHSDPELGILQLALFAVAIAFASATQDIVIDAYRIESAPESMQAALAATYIMGYRLAMIVAGAGSLFIVGRLQPDGVYLLEAWQTTYVIMAGFMCVGLITTCCVREPMVDLQHDLFLTQEKEQYYATFMPARAARLCAWFYGSFICPFQDFFSRFGKTAWIILLLISCYRISDIVMGVMANVFYVDLGFLEQEIATISKLYGVIMTLVGAFLGGIILVQLGTLRTLMLGAVLVSITNLLFILQYYAGHDTTILTLVISADNLGAGIATSAFVAYLSSLTNAGYSATQYALLSSIVVLFPKFIAGFSGVFVEAYGYPLFFFFSSCMGLPVVFLIWWLMRYPTPKATPTKKADAI